jgi:hypothetical protein
MVALVLLKTTVLHVLLRIVYIPVQLSRKSFSDSLQKALGEGLRGMILEK